MNLVTVFKEKRKFLLSITILGILNSILYSSLLVVINNGIREEKEFEILENYSEWVFVGLVIFSFVCRRIFQSKMISFTHNILFDFQLSIIQKVRFATYKAFKNIGVQKVYTAIGDTKLIGQLPRFFVDAMNNVVILLCGLAYLFYTSSVSTVVILGTTIFLGFFYWYRNQKISKDLNNVRDLENDYYQYLQDLLYGFKEIKMSVDRNKNIYDNFIERNRLKTKDLEISTSIRYLNNELLGSYSWYILLGSAIFLLPSIYEITIAQVTTFVIVIFYLMGPINFIMGSFPFLTRLQISISRLQGFDKEMTEKINNKQGFGEPIKVQEVEQIRFEDIYYTYKNEKLGREFTLGPVNLTLKKGEIVFIIGENGSGKSTFLLLLAGLFRPKSGNIYLNDQLITAENYAQYSNYISTVFTDAHLFSEQYDNYNLDDENEIWKSFKEAMGLSDVLRVDKDKKLVDSNLSRGQQKRLLMAYSLMENKQILLLDEWAAEQDPKFRYKFYHHLLRYIKGLGKTVVAITHDDRYFECADRIISFHDGKLVKDEYLQREKTVEYELPSL